jgi:hypothetical protein
MTKWTYTFTDLLTGEEKASLPLSGVSFDTQLCAPGSLTAFLPTSDPKLRAVNPWAATTPRRTALYVELDNEVVWGGVLWGRSRKAGDAGLTLTAGTFESWLGFQLLRYDLSFTQQTAAAIGGALVDEVQSYPSTNIGLAWAAAGAGPQLLRDREYVAAELRTALQLIGNFAEIQDPAEYRVDVSKGPVGYTRTLLIGEPRLGRTTDESNLAAIYTVGGPRPGTLLNWTDTEDGSAGGNAVASTFEVADPRWWLLRTEGTPTGGTFTLRYGTQVTTALAWNASPAAVQAALEALPAVAAGRVTVSGSAGDWSVGFSTLPALTQTLTVADALVTGSPPGGIAYGSTTAARWRQLLAAGWKRRYMPARTTAAQLIYDKLGQAQPGDVAEDWSWKGNPPVVRQHNDALVALAYAALGPAYWSNQTAGRNWLASYIAANSATSATGGRGWVTEATAGVAKDQIYPPGAPISARVVAQRDPEKTMKRFYLATVDDVNSDELVAGFPEQMTPLSGSGVTDPSLADEAAIAELLDRLNAERRLDGLEVHPSLLGQVFPGDDLLVQITDPSYEEWPDPYETSVRVVGIKVTPDTDTAPTKVTLSVVPLLPRLPPSVTMSATLLRVLNRLRQLETATAAAPLGGISASS